LDELQQLPNIPTQPKPAPTDDARCFEVRDIELQGVTLKQR